MRTRKGDGKSCLRLSKIIAEHFGCSVDCVKIYPSGGRSKEIVSWEAFVTERGKPTRTVISWSNVSECIKKRNKISFYPEHIPHSFVFDVEVSK